MSFYRRCGKRALDILGGVVTLPLVAVATCVVGLAIKIDDGGPIFYLSERRGRNGAAFVILKFRSMVLNAPDLRNEDLSTVNADDDPRVTRVGRFIRKFSVDEMPQFLNVLVGDMSLVGPRPNMNGRPWDELTAVEKKRVQVRPGITGAAQAKYRNSATTTQKYEIDCHYVDEVSFMTDLRILWETLVAVSKARGINSASTGGRAEDAGAAHE